MSAKRTIDVRKQRNMTAVETFRLCLSGIKHRLLRSILTLAVVTLAVSFFMFLLSENVFVGSVGRGIQARLFEQRLAGRVLNKLYNPASTMTLSRRLSMSSESELEEFAAVTGWKVARVRRLSNLCRDEQAYLEFFDELPVGKRTVLVGKLRGREIFRALQDPTEGESFRERIEPMLDLRVPGDVAGLLTFVSEYPELEEQLSRFAADWNAVQDDFTAATTRLSGPDTTIEVWLSAASQDEVAQWAELVREHGYSLSDKDLQTIQKQLETAVLNERVSAELSLPANAEEWRKVFKGKRMSIEEKILRLSDPRAGKVLDGEYAAADLASLADTAAYEKRLMSLERKLAGKFDAAEEGAFNLSGRQVVLLVISFMVCMVGIANAMLMSITERFREIATMKCLGATDRFILIQFMMEAALQGLTGGLLGMLLGFVIASGKNGIAAGGYLFEYWPGVALMISALISVGAGVVLSALASVYPSWAASRMAPMEAMRVE